MSRLRRLLPCVAAIAVVVPAPAQASHGQFMIFQATRELRNDDAALRSRTFDEIQSLGARWIRVVLYWRDVAPHAHSKHRPHFAESDPAAYDWARYDRIVSEARARGLHVLMTVSGPVPKWATRSHHSYVNRPSAVRFGRFMTAVGRRYRASVGWWSIWNEPNHPDFLGPQYVGHGRHRRPYSPHLYRGLVRAALGGLHRSGNGRDRVLIGETAPRGTPHVVSPLAFVRGVLCRGCSRLDVDGWAHHPYTTRSGPWFVSPRPGDVTIGSLSRLTRALDRAARYHAVRRHLGVYLTEFGVQSRPDPFIGVSLGRQADYRSIGERIAYRNPRVRAFSQYLMRDDLPRKGRPIVRYSGFESGLRTSGGRQKPAYAAFRLPLTASRVGHRRPRVSLWGLVRPASGRTSVLIEYRAAHGKHWHRLKRARTDHRGYWGTVTAYHRGRDYRVGWRDVDGRMRWGARTNVYRR